MEVEDKDDFSAIETKYKNLLSHLNNKYKVRAHKKNADLCRKHGNLMPGRVAARSWLGARIRQILSTAGSGGCWGRRFLLHNAIMGFTLCGFSQFCTSSIYQYFPIHFSFYMVFGTSHLFIKHL